MEKITKSDIKSAFYRSIPTALDSYFGFIISMMLLTIVLGIFAYFGYNTLSINANNIHGMKAILYAPFIGCYLGMIFGLVLNIFSFVGIFVYKLFMDKK